MAYTQTSALEGTRLQCVEMVDEAERMLQETQDVAIEKNLFEKSTAFESAFQAAEFGIVAFRESDYLSMDVPSMQALTQTVVTQCQYTLLPPLLFLHYTSSFHSLPVWQIDLDNGVGRYCADLIESELQRIREEEKARFNKLLGVWGSRDKKAATGVPLWNRKTGGTSEKGIFKVKDVSVFHDEGYSFHKPLLGTSE